MRIHLINLPKLKFFKHNRNTLIIFVIHICECPNFAIWLVKLQNHGVEE